jgi:hypothetical protein
MKALLSFALLALSTVPVVAAQKAVRQFDQEISEYTSCIKLEEDAQLKGDKLTDEQKKAIQAQQAMKNNAAVDADQALADRLNEQIRIFKSKQSANKG